MHTKRKKPSHRARHKQKIPICAVLQRTDLTTRQKLKVLQICSLRKRVREDVALGEKIIIHSVCAPSMVFILWYICCIIICCCFICCIMKSILWDTA